MCTRVLRALLVWRFFLSAAETGQSLRVFFESDRDVFAHVFYLRINMSPLRTSDPSFLCFVFKCGTVVPQQIDLFV